MVVVTRWFRHIDTQLIVFNYVLTKLLYNTLSSLVVEQEMFPHVSIVIHCIVP